MICRLIAPKIVLNKIAIDELLTEAGRMNAEKRQSAKWIRCKNATA